MVEITYQMVLSTIQTAGLLIGIFYYIMALRNQSKARRTQLYLQMLNKFSQSDMIDAQMKFKDVKWSTAKDFIEDWRNPEGRMAVATLANWYEGLGVLVKENLLDIRVVALLLTGLVIDFWDKFMPIIDETRELLGSPRFLSENEYLYNELMKFRSEHPEIQEV
ncbi:MAG: DUF4760 domain-containing protein [Candidatus Thorarchaeota archaeon]|jgi:hypothetical protein